jgi:quercetin dioxygenase-like cupin family protein
VNGTTLVALLALALLGQQGADGGQRPYSAQERAAPRPGVDGGQRRYSVQEPDVPRSADGVQILLGAHTVGTAQPSLQLVTIERDGRRPVQARPEATLWYVLEGELKLEPDGTRLGRGDAVYLPAGTPRGWARPNPRAKATRLLVFSAAASADTGAPRQSASADAEALGRSASADAGAPGRSAGAATTGPSVGPRMRRGADAQRFVIAQGKGGYSLLFDAALAGDASASLGLLRLSSGAAVPEHVHASEAELLFLLSGEVEMTVRGEKVSVRPGGAIHIPPNAPHAARVISREPLEAVQLYSPGGPEQRFKAVPEK